jgi:hypothetical protein
MLRGNAILLDYQVMRHIVDMEAIHTIEATETMQTLIVGGAITDIGPSPRTNVGRPQHGGAEPVAGEQRELHVVAVLADRPA